MHRSGEDVAGRTGQGGYDRPVAAGEGIEQRALADVGPASEDDAGALGGLGHVAGLGGQAGQCGCQIAHSSTQYARGRQVQRLVGQVNGGLDFGEGFGQGGGDFFAESADSPAQGGHGRAELVAIGGVDDVGDGLGLGQVDPPGEEGAEGELARPCLPSAGGDKGGQDRLDARRGAGQVEFDEVLAGVTSGGAEEVGSGGQVDPRAPPRDDALDAAEAGRLFQRTVPRGEDSLGQGQGLRARQSYDRAGARAGGAGEGDDGVLGVGHGRQISKTLLNSPAPGGILGRLINLTTEKGQCMGTLLGSLLKLQAVERQLAQVRGRKRTRLNIIRVQEGKVEQLRGEQESLHQRSLSRRKDGDQLALDLKAKEEQASKLRTSLNSAKTNKEYAAILTQLNGLKADNAKVEEQVLVVMQEVEAIAAEEVKAQERIAQEVARLEEMKKFTSDELTRLEGMIEALSAQRAEATQGVPAQALTAFERIAGNYDGEGMANIEVRGTKPPYDYVCGGCYMSLNAEHVNALRTRDEIRTCDNCQRILYLKSEDGK